MPAYRGEARHPSLRSTARDDSYLRIFRKKPFADLLTAFRQDQTVTRYASMGMFWGTAVIPPIR